MNKNTNLVEIYYLADEFCKELYKVMEGHTIEQNNDKKRRIRKAVGKKRKFSVNNQKKTKTKK
jgi:hypothetical protein